MERSNSAREFFDGWQLILVSTLGISFIASHVYSLGVLIEPIEKELGWSRSKITSGLTLVGIMSAVLAPLAGALIDKFGTRAITLLGVFLYCSGFVVIGLTQSIFAAWLLGWSILGLAVCLSPTSWTLALASRFDKLRGFAFGLAMSGIGITAMILPRIVNEVEAQFGWRAAYFGISIFGILIIIPLLYFFFHDARSVSRTRVKNGNIDEKKLLSGLDIKEAFRSHQFIKLLFCALFGTSAITAIIVNFVPIITSFNLDRESVATIAGLIGLGSILGRVSIGLLLDRMNARIMGVFAYLLPCLPCLVLLNIDITPGIAAVVAFVIGFAVGGELNVLVYLSTKYFGMKNYGVLFGCMAGMMSFAAGLGPLFLSTTYDFTGSYQIGMVALLPAFCLVAALIFSLGKYPSFKPL